MTIDREVMIQITGLNEAIQGLREDVSHLAQKIDINNMNMSKQVGVELSLVRDAATRASRNVVEFGGRLDEFAEDQARYKTDFQWWIDHLTKLSDRLEAQSKQMAQLEVSLALDNATFKDWAAAKITQIGRIFRR